MKNLISSFFQKDKHPAYVKTWLIGCFFLIAVQSNGQNCELPTGFECTTLAGNFRMITTSKTFSQMIAAGELLPQATSSTAPQFLIICQTITDDLPGWYNFAAGSEIVFLNNNSGVIVNSGANLHFQTSYLHGCEKLWDKILVKSGGVLYISLGSRVEDAVTAVHLEPQSFFLAILSTFDGNYTCINAGGSGSPNQHALTTILGGNVFSGQKQLIENYTPNSQTPACFYSRPMYGITAQNVQYMTVGLVGFSPNQFRDFTESWSCSTFNPAAPTGILAHNSSVLVTHSLFQNIANGSGGKGVDFFVSTGAASVLNFTGLGTTGQPTFDNVQTGVYGLGNMTIQNSRFNNLERGIYLTGIPAPYQVSILNNVFENVDDHSVFADQISPIYKLEVNGNRFDDNDSSPSLGLGFPRAGVRIHSFVPGQQNSWIFSNIFVNTPKTGSFSFSNRGVWVRNLNGSIIEQNNFTDNFGGTSMRYEGVSLYNAQTSMLSNTFTGAGNWSVHPSTAIQVQESPQCWLNCNVANQTKLGWEFQGMNSDGAVLERNELNAHHDGLLLLYDAIIGPQNNRYNRWIGNSSNTEARFEGRDPSIFIDQFFVALSKFRIHTFDVSTDFWPDPRLFGSVPDPGLWFTTGQPAEVLCSAFAFTGGGYEAFGGLTEADQRIIASDFDPVYGYEAGRWEAALRLYMHLEQRPDLRPENSDAALWYAAQTESTVGQLGRIYGGILALNRRSSTEHGAIGDASEQYAEIADAITEKDEQIAEAFTNSQDPSSLLSDREGLQTQLASALAAYSAMITDLNNGARSAAQTLLTQVDGITTSESYEADFKTVCRILLQAFVNGSVATGTDALALETIAGQCRYSGGLAVVLARASLEEQDWSSHDACPNSELERSGPLTDMFASTTRLYPNPANDRLIIEFPSLVEYGTAVLRDVNGRILQEWRIEAQRRMDLRMDTSLPEGVYLLEVNNDVAGRQTFKVVVQHNR